MNNNNGVISINRSIKIIQTEGKLQITKAFAEKNLSKSALKYAEKTDTHYLYNWGKTAYIVIFELPQLFNSNFAEILRYMVNYCGAYLQDNRITESNIYLKYAENSNKIINH